MFTIDKRIRALERGPNCAHHLFEKTVYQLGNEALLMSELRQSENN